MSRQDPGAQSRGPLTPPNAVIFCLEEGLVPPILPMCFSSSLASTSSSHHQLGLGGDWANPHLGEMEPGPFSSSEQMLPQCKAPFLFSVCAIQSRDGPQAQRERAAGRQGQVSHTFSALTSTEAHDMSEDTSAVPWPSIRLRVILGWGWWSLSPYC